MKNTIISILFSIIMTFTICGCKCIGKDCNKDKPVAPETYSNEQGDKADPVLPPMDLWWK